MVWASPQIRGEERYLLSPETVRVSATVPVLVEAADRPGRLFGEAHQTGYLRSPLAADPDQLAVCLMSLQPDRQETSGLGPETPVRAHGAGNVHQSFWKTAPICPL